MKLFIKTDVKERKFILPIPLRMVVKALLKEAGATDFTQVKAITRALKEYKKEHGVFTLVEVEEKDGPMVKIII